MNQNFMKEKPVMPLVISMALPMTFSMLVNALYNIIDSYLWRASARCDDGTFFGVPIAESGQCSCYRICNRNQCDNRIFSWSTKAEHGG